MHQRHFEAIIFSVKAALATVVAALVYQFVKLPGAAWVAAVSAVLVTQPSIHSSFKASWMRVVANLAGAFGGAALGIALGQPLVAMAVGVLITGLVCYLLKQDDALRPAFVAVILVTLAGRMINGTVRWNGSPASSSGACVHWSWDFYSTNSPACQALEKDGRKTSQTFQNNF
ncbi:MAG: aromatic acid exporter family protein [Limisphaerales bacterium]